MSARPVLETTSMTSGNCLRMLLGPAFAGRAIAVSEMLGMRKVCTAIEPSSSEGRNSVPMRGTSANAPPSASTAGMTTSHGMSHARLERHEVDLLSASGCETGSCSCGTCLRKKRAEHRHERERKDQRAEQRKGNGERERAEHFSLEAFAA